jgi:hypothetical protein
LYLELGPGRSLAKLLDVLKERGQSAGKPQVTTRLQTLEKWCSEGHWVADAIQYDADCAARRAELLAEEERRQAEQDVKLLAETLRGAAGVSALILSTYAGKDGALARPDAGLRDVAALLKVCLEGLGLVHPGGRLGSYRPPPDIERVIQQGTPEQRLRALTAIRELTAVVDEFDGQRGS